MASLKITVRSSETEERTIEVPIPRPGPLGGTTEVREFLAMRARERKNALRRRRIKRTCLALSAATAVAAFAVDRWRAMAGTEAPLAQVDPAPLPEMAGTGDDRPAASFDEPLSLAAVAPAVLTSTAPAPAPAAAAPADGGRCRTDFAQRRWRAAVENCTAAFQAAPTATVALQVAHAHWARGDVGLSGQWAEKAVALGTRDADAYVLIGHAERRAGKPHEAIAAYRQYLRTSPRGWHVRTVRAALRRLRPVEQHQAVAGEPTAQVIR